MEQIIVLTPDQIRQLVRDTVSEVLERTPGKSSETRFYSREEASDLLRISLPTLDKYAKQGLIRSQRLGGRILFAAEDIQSGLERVDDLKYKRLS